MNQKQAAMDDRQYLFGGLQVAANRIDTLLERELAAFGATSRQWFLSIVAENLFEGPPTLKELARAMGSSHQNVKQLALKLADRNLVRLEKDSRDARVTRVHLTPASRELWARVKPTGDGYVRRLFEGMDPADLAAARRVVARLLDNLDRIERPAAREGDPS
jgi:DNA-binding MarR family transcriptional regulator